jgi:hypothetical protein
MTFPTRRNWPLRLALLALAALFFGYVFGWPLVDPLSESSTQGGRAKIGTGTFSNADFPGFSPFPLGTSPILSHSLRMRFFEAVIAVWFFSSVLAWAAF